MAGTFAFLLFILFFQRNAAHMDVIENNICWQNDNLMRGCTCAHSYLGQNRIERVQHITHTDIFSQKKNHTRPRSTQPDHCHPPTNQKKHFCIHFLWRLKILSFASMSWTVSRPSSTFPVRHSLVGCNVCAGRRLLSAVDITISTSGTRGTNKYVIGDHQTNSINT